MESHGPGHGFFFVKSIEIGERNMKDKTVDSEQYLKESLKKLLDTIDQEGYSNTFYNSFKTFHVICTKSILDIDVDKMGDYEYMKTSLLINLCARGMELCDELDLGLDITYIPFLTTSINVMQTMAYINALKSNFFSPKEIESFRYSLSPMHMIELKKGNIPYSYSNDVMESFEKFKKSSGLVDEVIFDEDDPYSTFNLSKIWISDRGLNDHSNLYEKFLPEDLFELYNYLMICLDSLNNVVNQINAIDRVLIKNLVINAYFVAMENIQSEQIYDYGEYFKNDDRYNKIMDRFEQYGQDYNKAAEILKDVQDDVSRNILDIVTDTLYSNLLLETHANGANNGLSFLWITRYAYCIDRLLLLSKNLFTDGTLFQENHEFIVRKLLDTKVRTSLTKNDEVNPIYHKDELGIEGIDEAKKIFERWNIQEGVVNANIEYIVNGTEYMNCLDILESVYVPNDLNFIRMIITGIMMYLAMGGLLPKGKLMKLLEILKNTLNLKATDPHK